MSNITLHTCISAYGVTFKVHSCWKTSDLSVLPSLFNIIYPDLTIYSCFSSLKHSHPSWLQMLLCTTRLLLINCSSNCFSHSNLALHDPKFQLDIYIEFSCSRIPTSATVLSLHSDIKNSLGYDSFKD